MACLGGWTLDGDDILDPRTVSVSRSAVAVTNRTLDGGFTRDYVGSAKKIITASYEFADADSAELILGHWQDQQENGTSKTLTIDKDGLQFNAPVLIDLPQTEFPARLRFDWQAFVVTYTEI